MPNGIERYGAWRDGALAPRTTRETRETPRENSPFSDLMDVVAGAGEVTARAFLGFSRGGVPGALASVFAGDAVEGAGLGSLNGGQLDPMQLMRLQMEIQRRQQIIQLMTNISKTEHEGHMSIVRNMRS